MVGKANESVRMQGTDPGQVVVAAAGNETHRADAVGLQFLQPAVRLDLVPGMVRGGFRSWEIPHAPPLCTVGARHLLNHPSLGQIRVRRWLGGSVHIAEPRQLRRKMDVEVNNFYAVVHEVLLREDFLARGE